jgi:hypothetical protein
MLNDTQCRNAKPQDKPYTLPAPGASRMTGGQGRYCYCLNRDTIICYH